MVYKLLVSAFLVLFVAACATKPKDAADSSGSGSSSSDSSVEGTISETAGSGIVKGSQEDLIVNVGDRVFLVMIVQIWTLTLLSFCKIKLLG